MASALFRVYRLGSSHKCCTNLRSAIINTFLRGCNNVAASEVEKVTYPRHQNQFDLNILNATNMRSLFDNLEPKSLTIIQAVSVVAALRKLLFNQVITCADVEKDGKFDLVCNVISRNIHSMNYTTLIVTLKNLFALELPDDKFIIQSVETEILWKIRKMNLKQLLHLLSFHVEHQVTEIQRKIVAETTEKIQQRWFELCDCRDIVLLFKLSPHFQSDFLDKIEDRAIELVEKMSVEDQHRILVVLGEQKLRPIHLLRAIAFHMSKHQQKLSVKNMTSVVFAMHILSFPDVALLQRISSDLVPEIHQIEKSSTLGMILKSFGHLRWRHPDVMSASADWFQKHENDCRIQDWLAFLLTSAHVNYELEDDALIMESLNRVTRENVTLKTTWLDLVWSLVLLHRAQPHHLSSVLTPEFHQAIQSSPGYHPLQHGRKLLNINAAAKWEMANYNGPFLSESFIKDCCSNLPTNDALRNSVISTLSNYVPLGKFLSSSKHTESGVVVDGEFLVDGNGKPILLNNNKEENSLKSTEKDVYRIALLVQNFKDFTLHNVKLTGQSNFAARILKNMGYSVMQVPYMEYNPQATTVKRLQYLQQKLLDSIQHVSTSDRTKAVTK